VVEPMLNGRDQELKFAVLAGKLIADNPADPEAKRLIEESKLLADKPVIPANGRILSSLLSFIGDHKIAGRTELREKLGPALNSLATDSADAEFHNARAWLYIDAPEMGTVDELALKKTK